MQVTEKDLSNEQKEVYDNILKWINDKNDRLLTFGGVAGSGKSTLTSLIAQKLNQSIAFVAFTGKAANVLRQKLDANKINYSYCGTIHGLIYIPIVDKHSLKVIGWRKRTIIDEDLIFVDEASMINDRMFRDLQSYGKKILAIGDFAQLPAIGSDINLMDNPQLKLKETHRAAKGNPIIALSTMIRHDEDISQFISQDNRVRFLKKSSDELGEFAIGMYSDKTKRLDAAILCYFNKSRILYNSIIRKALGFREEPETGDIIICLKNNQLSVDKAIFNGMRGFVNSSVSLKHHFNMDIDFVDENIKINENVFKYQFNEEMTLQSPLEAKAFGVNVKSWEKLGLLFDYGYALTVHKCLDPNTLVETPNGLCRIKNLPEIGIIATPNGFSDYKNLIHNAPDKMLEIETSDGFRIKVTPEHGIDVWDKIKGYIKKQAKYIEKEDIVRLKLGTEWAEKEYINVHGAISGDIREKIYNIPTKLDEDLAELLGMLVADGTIFKRGFRVAKRHKDYIDHFENLCLKLFGFNVKRFFILGAYHAEVNSTYLTRWISGFIGVQPNNKAIPEEIFKSGLKVQAAFLRGLFEDGSVHIKNNKLDHIEFSSSFDQMIRDIKIMLLRFGIISGIVRTDFGYRIAIYGTNAKKFANIIGLISKTKKDKLCADVGNESRYLVPILLEEIQQLAKDNGGINILTNSEKTARTRRQFSRDMFEKFLLRLPIKNDLWNKLNDRLKFHHSKIISIKEYVGESMCVEVPNGHQFIQDGFCGWNSQGSGFENVIVFVERSQYCSDDDFRRWLYTAVTRSSNNLVLVH